MVAIVYGSSSLRELFITKFKAQFRRGFTKVVVTRAGRLREWSQGELRLKDNVDRGGCKNNLTNSSVCTTLQTYHTKVESSDNCKQYTV